MKNFTKNELEIAYEVVSALYDEKDTELDLLQKIADKIDLKSMTTERIDISDLLIKNTKQTIKNLEEQNKTDLVDMYKLFLKNQMKERGE